jgi:RNA polymerase sigma factor (sigma-70 family)
VDRYKPEVAKLSTFAYLSLRGRILDYLGALPALTPVSLEDFFQDFACPGPAPGEELETAKRRHLMENAFDRLSPCQRQIMRMRYLDEMPIQEIGERLGVHRSNVSAHHSRAVKHLRHSREMKDLAA